MKIRHYKTKWAQEDTAFGQSLNLVILESKTNECNSKFEMREWEFETLFNSLFTLCFEDKKIPYLQIVKEWNEGIGFCDLDEVPSVIGDVEETIRSIQLVEPELQESYGVLTSDDMKMLIQFLDINQDKIITIKQA